MGKKKKIETKAQPRNPQDFLNDLKFIRKNRDKKVNSNHVNGHVKQNGYQRSQNDNDQQIQNEKLPIFFKTVQKLIKNKKTEHLSQPQSKIKKQQNKETQTNQQKEQQNQVQQRWAF